ncbi:MAG TPA: multidrug efflux RND transporter permease subunit [Rhodanobacteraceae bacterium]|jgi:multidrug efflux pump|nr:multidrug efflux RND transporter permease subunit [Rhodanobacteraceae bacterium]
MSRFFIDRPIFAWVLAILITLGGTIAILNLPIEAYPTIAPPSVQVRANYPGANANVVQSTVTQVIEQNLTGIDHLLYFSSSSSSTGLANITLYFDPGTDLDTAAVQTQNAVSAAEPRLPQAVKDLGITVRKSNTGFLMGVSLLDPTGRLDQSALNNVIAAQLIDPISRVEGVGDVNQFGAPYAMRIWLNPLELQGYGLTATDALDAVRAQNVMFAAGSVGAEPATAGQGITATVSAESSFATPEQFRHIILRTNPDGTTVTLGDVARVELGSDNYGNFSRLDGKPVASFGISMSPGANALAVADAVQARMEDLAKNLPPGVTWTIPFESYTFVRVSIVEVVKTLGEAIVLVFLVMLLFLQNLRATLIPTLVVPVALTGAFIGMYAFGFSINVLTLFGLVLAIGIVVDDAIVVVENVERLMREEGLSPKEATRKGMTQITGAIVAVTTVLASVFVPAALMPGSVGAIYRQFSVTIAVSMALSALMALTFTPALCASLLRPEHEHANRFLRGFNNAYEGLARHYLARLGKAVRHTPRWMIGYALAIVVAVVLLIQLPSSFVPSEDQGSIIATVQLPPGATIGRTRAVTEEVEGILKKDPAISNAFTIGGFSFVGRGENVGMAFIHLKDWSDRSRSAEEVVNDLNQKFARIRDAQVFAVNPAVIRGLGRFGGFDFELQDQGGLGHDALVAAKDKLLAAAAKDKRLQNVRVNGMEDAPTVNMHVDRVQAESMGVSVTDVYNAIRLMLSQVYANDFYYQGRVLRVEMQADAPFRMSPSDIGDFYTRSSSGAMVPLSSVVDTQWSMAPPELDRYDGVGSIGITGTAAPGYSSGDAIAAMQELVAKYLPASFGYEWSGQSLQEILSGAQAPMLFGLSILVVFLCLAALYESWSIPLAVMLVIPLGVLGSVLLTSIRGLENDVYFKVGLIAIIGLSVKNAILIVEFAVSLQKEGKGLIAATLEACRIRLRPILMTSIAFILGVLPLAISSGAGANSRHAIGTGVIGGMLGATALGIMLVPVFYVVVRRLLGDKSDGTEVGDADGGEIRPSDSP